MKTKNLFIVMLIVVSIFAFSCKKGSGSTAPDQHTLPVVSWQFIKGTLNGTVSGGNFTGTATVLDEDGNAIKDSSGNALTVAVSGTANSSEIDGTISGTYTGSLGTDGTEAFLKINTAAASTTSTKSGTIDATFTGSFNSKTFSKNATITITGTPINTTAVNGTFTGTVSGSNFTGTFTDAQSNTFPISGTVTGDAAGTVSGTINGLIDNNTGQFTGSIDGGAFNGTVGSTGTISINLTYNGTATTITGNLAGDGSVVNINTTVEVPVIADGTFTATFTDENGNTGTITGTLSSHATDNATITINGTVNADGTFTGTVNGTYPGVSGSSETYTGTITVHGGTQVNISGTLNSDGSIVVTDGGDQTDTEPGDDSEVPSTWTIPNEPIPSVITDAINDAIDNGKNAVIYWKSNYRWQPVKTGTYSVQLFWNDPSGTDPQYRGDYRAIKIVHNDDNATLTITYGWYDKDGSINVKPLRTIGLSEVFEEPHTAEYIKNDYSKATGTPRETLMKHVRQFFWWNGILYAS